MSPPDPRRDYIIDVIRSLRDGEVVTYGDIAADAGFARHSRLVGRILATTEEDLPWWRVVNSVGRLVPGHEIEQAQLLRIEGVECSAGRVRKARYGRFACAHSCWRSSAGPADEWQTSTGARAPELVRGGSHTSWHTRALEHAHAKSEGEFRLTSRRPKAVPRTSRRIKFTRNSQYRLNRLLPCAPIFTECDFLVLTGHLLVLRSSSALR